MSRPLAKPKPDRSALADKARQLVVQARELGAKGWTPATSGNFSMRLDDAHAAITVSGCDKERLVETDIMVVDLDGKPVATDRAPSAETPLHTQLYRRQLDIGCVLHTHSQTQTLASRRFAGQGRISFAGYELQKAFEGVKTHEGVVALAILPNTQDIPALAENVSRLLEAGPCWGYLIAGHGLYAWGRDAAQARRHLEAFEFLLRCELEERRSS